MRSRPSCSPTRCWASGTSVAGAASRRPAAWSRTVAFLGWFACLFTGRMPQGFRDLAAYAIGYSAQVDRLPPAAHRPLSEQRPGGLRVRQRLPQRSDPAARRRRPAPLPPDGVLPPSARGAALRLAPALGHRRLLRGDRELVRDALPRASPAGSAPLPLRPSALPDARLRLPAARREPVSGLHRAAGHLSGRCRDRSARAPEPLDDRLPAVPRGAGVPGRGRARHRRLPGGPAELVLRARPRPGAARPAEPRARSQLRYSAQIFGYVVPAHRPLPVQRPAGGLAADAGARDRRSAPDPAPEVDPPGGRARGRLGRRASRCSGRPTCPATSTSRTSTRTRYFSAAQLEERARLRGASCGSTRCCPRSCWSSCSSLYARHGERFTRESAAGRIGTGMLLGMLGLRVRLAGPAAVRPRRSCGGSAATTSPTRATWSGSWQLVLGSAACSSFVCVAILIVMALAGRCATAGGSRRRRCSWRSACCSPSSGPFLMPRPRPAAGRPAGRRTPAGSQREQGVAGHPGRGRGGGRVHDEPNAFATGLGPTRRVILWDTLLDGRFTEREVRVVLAHELGHHSRDHIWKLIGWFALFALPVAWVIALAHAPARRHVRGRAPCRSRSSSLVVLQIATTPAQNVVIAPLRGRGGLGLARRRRATRAPRASCSRSWRETSLADPDPPGPGHTCCSRPIRRSMQRIAMAEAWRGARRLAPVRGSLALTNVNHRRKVVMEAATPAPPVAAARLPGPLRRRVPGAALALEDLRQVAVRDPALHHPLPAPDRARRDGLHRLLRDPVHEEVAARDVRLRRPDPALDRERARLRVPAPARRVPAVLGRRRASTR